MNDKEFMECKNEIIAALDKYELDLIEIPRVISAALNEKIAFSGWLSIIEFIELPAFREERGKN